MPLHNTPRWSPSQWPTSPWPLSIKRGCMGRIYIQKHTHSHTHACTDVYTHTTRRMLLFCWVLKYIVLFRVVVCFILWSRMAMVSLPLPPYPSHSLVIRNKLHIVNVNTFTRPCTPPFLVYNSSVATLPYDIIKLTFVIVLMEAPLAAVTTPYI